MKVLLTVVIGVVGLGAIWILLRSWRRLQRLRQARQDFEDLSPEWLVENSYKTDGDDSWK